MRTSEDARYRPQVGDTMSFVGSVTGQTKIWTFCGSYIASSDGMASFPPDAWLSLDEEDVRVQQCVWTPAPAEAA